MKKVLLLTVLIVILNSQIVFSGLIPEPLFTETPGPSSLGEDLDKLKKEVKNIKKIKTEFNLSEDYNYINKEKNKKMVSYKPFLEESLKLIYDWDKKTYAKQVEKLKQYSNDNFYQKLMNDREYNLNEIKKNNISSSVQIQKIFDLRGTAQDMVYFIKANIVLRKLKNYKPVSKEESTIEIFFRPVKVHKDNIHGLEITKIKEIRNNKKKKKEKDRKPKKFTRFILNEIYTLNRTNIGNKTQKLKPYLNKNLEKRLNEKFKIITKKIKVQSYNSQIDIKNIEKIMYMHQSNSKYQMEVKAEIDRKQGNMRLTKKIQGIILTFEETEFSEKNKYGFKLIKLDETSSHNKKEEKNKIQETAEDIINEIMLLFMIIFAILLFLTILINIVEKQENNNKTLSHNKNTPFEKMKTKFKKLKENIQELEENIDTLKEFKDEKKEKVKNTKEKAKDLKEKSNQRKAKELLAGNRYQYRLDKIKEYEEEIEEKEELLKEYNNALDNLEFKLEKLRDKKKEKDLAKEEEENIAEINQTLDEIAKLKG